MSIKKIVNAVYSIRGRELLSTVVFAFGIRIVGAFSGFVATLLIARSLGAEEAGYYFLAFTMVTVLATVCRVGLDNVVLRFTSASPEYVFDVIKKSIILVVAVNIPCVVITLFSADFFAKYYFGKPELAPVMRCMALGIFGLSALTIAAMVLQGLRKVSASIFILNIAINIILVACLYIFDVRVAAELAHLYSISAIIVAVVGYILIGTNCPRIGPSEIPWKLLFNSCTPLWLSAIMGQILQWSGQLVAGAYVSSELVAQLAVAQRTAMLSSFVLVAVNLVVAPRFAALHRHSKFAELESLAIKSVKLISILALPVIAVMLILPEELMSLFGAEFSDGAHLLQIMAVGQSINALAGSVFILLVMSGYEKDVRNITLVTSLVGISLTWFLTKEFGVSGTAVAIAFSVAFQNLIAVYFVKKRLGFNMLVIWQ